MSYTNLNNLRRVAIWEVHGRKCMYCSEPITFSNLDIDHIIPERLLETPNELKNVLADYSLPPDFDLNDVRNLVPSHRRCNSRKAGMLLNKNSSLYYLGIAQTKSNRAFAEEQIALKRSKKERVLVSLQIALESGELSPSEVMAVLEKIESGADAFEIIHPIEFSNRIIIGLLSQHDIESLFDEPILPRKHGLEYLRMVKGSGDHASSRIVRTCREWAEAKREKYEAATTYDIKEEAFFHRVHAVVRAMSDARVPDISFINSPIQGIHNLDLLPVTFLPYLSKDSETELSVMNNAGLTVADLVTNKRVIIEHTSRHHLSLSFERMGKVYWEILRADLNGDGIEDILLSTYSYATEGTLGFGDIAIITKLSSDSKFEILSDAHFRPQ